ncbi:uncharacterized protein MELLADRAFT_87549 [Melampsora larici-populina 98AG31]|uniref:Secreted protein n=1 Tax=Melampsora larici-populina (strain 98AG31 / pathotype 3-4-7) TaxID=747676 RepID=F4RNR1_MELLP|nr:uncharacterized protein MELLADRAFT_87549 [Melampsora larici-populina 98AG31]EGG06051.1 secreted protein [Melampsora larici-populina 98AG31]
MYFLFNRFLICITVHIIIGDKFLTKSVLNTQDHHGYPCSKSADQSGHGSETCIGEDCQHLVDRRSNTLEKRQRPNTAKGTGTPPAGASGTGAANNVKDESKEDQKKWLDAHNKFRATYKAPPLVWNDQITPAAKAVVGTCVYEHSKGPYGENLAAGHTNLEKVVSDWVNGPNEKSAYNPSRPSFSHFTQVVWVATKSISCARNSCTSLKGLRTPQSPIIFWACEYFPPGNVIGQFPQNVKSGQGGAPL